MVDEALKRAIEAAGGPVALSKRLGISSQAIAQWDRCPPLRVLEVERETGVSRHELRPDIYPPEETRKRSKAGRPFPGNANAAGTPSGRVSA